MIDRLALLLDRFGAEPTLDDLRDVLWLARYLPPATAAQVASAEAQAPNPAPDTATGSSERSDHSAAPVDTRSSPQMRRVDVTDPASGPAGVYGGGQGGTGISARRIRLPGIAPLPAAMEIARALRPLGRRRPFGPPVVLDELASAERIAESRLPLPVLVPRRERWFDVVLAVEDTPSLVAWKSTAFQLQRLLERHGGFRAVTRVTLIHEAGRIAIRSAAGASLTSASMSDRHGRRLVIVVSDCTSAAWHDGAMGAGLAELGPRAPVAVAQPLPPSLWSNTALGFVEFSTRAGFPGAPTAQLQVVRPRWAEGERGPVVPVFALQPESVARWARMVMATGDAFAGAALLPIPDPVMPDEPGPAPPPAPLALLATFRTVALPDAQKLAACLAVVKPLTMPVMRLIQSAMLPGSDAAALAQVLIAGLVAPAASTGATSEDQRVYEMADEVRAQLAGSLLRSDWLRVNLAVQRFVEEETGQDFDFIAYLEDALGDDHLAPAALPFAQFARSLANRFRAPGVASSGSMRRSIDEAIFGNGLTVQAIHGLSTPARRLRWSPDGRLLALHDVGVDILDARSLAVGGRVREGPHVVEWLVHEDDRPVLEPLFRKLENEAERQSGQPFSFRLTTFDRKLPKTSSREQRSERSSASVTRLIALTRRFGVRNALLGGREWNRAVAGVFGAATLGDWTPVVLDAAWVDPSPAAWTTAWDGMLVNKADSQRTRDAVGALVARIRDGRRNEEPGRILDAAWGSGAGAAEVFSLRRAAGEDVIVDVVQGDAIGAPRWLGAPAGPRISIIDFDVDLASSTMAAIYASGEIWMWTAGADRQSRRVHQGQAYAIRWSPGTSVLGQLNSDGFFTVPIDFAAARPQHK